MIVKDFTTSSGGHGREAVENMQAESARSQIVGFIVPRWFLEAKAVESGEGDVSHALGHGRHGVRDWRLRFTTTNRYSRTRCGKNDSLQPHRQPQRMTDAPRLGSRFRTRDG